MYCSWTFARFTCLQRCFKTLFTTSRARCTIIFYQVQGIWCGFVIFLLCRKLRGIGERNGSGIRWIWWRLIFGRILLAKLPFLGKNTCWSLSQCSLHEHAKRRRWPKLCMEGHGNHLPSSEYQWPLGGVTINSRVAAIKNKHKTVFDAARSETIKQWCFCK